MNPVSQNILLDRVLVFMQFIDPNTNLRKSRRQPSGKSAALSRFRDVLSTMIFENRISKYYANFGNI